VTLEHIEGGFVADIAQERGEIHRIFERE
jgi:hypothetical protein